jgi:hypothetical protein
MEYKESPYPERDIRTLFWNVGISINEEPEKYVQTCIEAHIKEREKWENPNYFAEHWKATFGTEIPEEFKNVFNSNNQNEDLPF